MSSSDYVAGHFVKGTGARHGGLFADEGLRSRLLAMTQGGRSKLDMARELGCADRTIHRAFIADQELSAAWDAAAPLRVVPVRHGTMAGHSRGCRCKPCLAAYAVYQKARKRERIRMVRAGLVEVPCHGTAGGYTNWGCRCKPCRQAFTIHNKPYKDAWVKKVRGTEPRRHGTASGYQNYGCRCEKCRSWERKRYQARKARVAA